MLKNIFRAAICAGLTGHIANKNISYAENISTSHTPTFSNLRQRSEHDKRVKRKNLDSCYLLAGSSHPKLAKTVADLLDVKLGDVMLSRFADGEVNLQINDNFRGKHVYIVQTCSAPVTERVMELLLLISCVKRSGASRVTAIIPYFGYKHHRRSTPVSTKFQSRFLTSESMDFAKMLEAMEVDSVVSVDIQRPGQGQEACYFNVRVPLESIVSTKLFVEHLVEHENLVNPIVVVAPNAESLRKATKFQAGLEEHIANVRKSDKEFKGPIPKVSLAAFFEQDSGTGYSNNLELIGSAQFAGADVVIVDDIIESAETICRITKTVKAEGAKNVYACASHGLFTKCSLQRINESSLTKVFVTDSLPIVENIGSYAKISQLSVAPIIAKVILAEHYRGRLLLKDDTVVADD